MVFVPVLEGGAFFGGGGDFSIEQLGKGLRGNVAEIQAGRYP